MSMSTIIMTMKTMSIIIMTTKTMTMTMSMMKTVPVAAMIMRSMSITMSMMKTVPVAAMTMSTITIIMQMMYLPAGARRHRTNSSVQKLEEVLKKFVDSDNILRSKGMVESTDGTWLYFDMVPGEYEIREGEPDYTGRIVVIGTEIHEDELLKTFGL